MPTHNEDIRLIPIIQQTINTQIMTYPNHTYILCGDFNRNVALIGRQNEHGNTPPNEKDLMWKAYTENIALTYIPTNTNFSRQGSHNYTHTSLIDGFYIKTQNPTLFTFTMLMEQNLNSDHLPIILHVPPNILLARQPPPITNHTTIIKKSHSTRKSRKFKTKFFEENAIQLNEMTILLSKNHLNQEQWQQACNHMDQIIQKISKTIKNTCSMALLPTLTNKTTQQGGFLPRKLQKTWKKHINTYHLIWKAIYTTKNTTNGRTHSIINELNNHTHINIPPPPNDEVQKNDWIKKLSNAC